MSTIEGIEEEKKLYKEQVSYCPSSAAGIHEYPTDPDCSSKSSSASFAMILGMPNSKRCMES